MLARKAPSEAVVVAGVRLHLRDEVVLIGRRDDRVAAGTGRAYRHGVFSVQLLTVGTDHAGEVERDDDDEDGRDGCGREEAGAAAGPILVPVGRRPGVPHATSLRAVTSAPTASAGTA